ncbi:unnamed protein product [Miscanthus lutarioriparius]|uniref:Uncharacterized protein n=1 Tax=Miscanthus lutarioriparius TaxID=422564 RepID=A0A811NZP9_9POAL|nr:unnamed protein product [Miscanthus lutarioriparius]
MAPVVELPVDGLAYHGFAMILYDVLDSLGVPTEKLEYVCRGEPGPDGFKGHIVVHLKVPASEFVPMLRAFETLEVENSIASCVQSVSRTALRSVMRDAHDYLKTGPYCLLAAALDLNRFSELQITTADSAAHDEYIIAQDRYIMDVEMQNRRYRDLLFRCDEEFLKLECKEEEMVSKLEEERMGYDRMKTFYETREKSLREEIANLKDKVGEAELRHDYLESKVLECEDRIERQRHTLREFHKKEKHHGIRKLALEARCNMMEKLAVEAAVTTTYNMHHLVHYIKCTEYLQDKEIRKVQDVLLPVMRKKPRRQPFHIEATKLNFKVCPTEGYSEVPRTEMLDYTLTYVARIHRSDDELHAMEGTPEASTSGPSTPPDTC